MISDVHRFTFFADICPETKTLVLNCRNSNILFHLLRNTYKFVDDATYTRNLTSVSSVFSNPNPFDGFIDIRVCARIEMHFLF